MYVDVALHIPVDRTFTYAVPTESRGETVVGKRVLVPLGKRSLTGTVIAIRRSTDRQDTREITRVLDREPLFGEDDLRFYRWAAEYYFTPLGRAIGEILPGGIDIESLLWAVRLGEADDLKALQRDILGTLGRHTTGWPCAASRRNWGGRLFCRSFGNWKPGGSSGSRSASESPP